MNDNLDNQNLLNGNTPLFGSAYSPFGGNNMFTHKAGGGFSLYSNNRSTHNWQIVGKYDMCKSN